MDFNLWKHRILYLPRLFSKKEKILLCFFTAVFLISAGALVISFVSKNTTLAPDKSGIYREGLFKQPRFINPLYLANNDTDRDIANLVFSGLIRYNGKGEITGDLAEKWEISADKKNYTFYLKENAKWHDGEKVTADDAVFTVKTIQNPEYKSPLRPNWQGVTAEKIGEYAVRFSLKQPYAPFIENASLLILPKHLWEKIPPSNALLTELNLKPVGSGKYKFYDIETSPENTLVSYTLSANGGYYGKVPYISVFKFVFYPSEETLVQAFKNKDIDGFGSLSPQNFKSLAGEGITVYPLRLSRIFAVFFNRNKKEELQDAGIKTALDIAISRNELVKDTLQNEAAITDSPIPPGSFGYSPQIAEASSTEEKDEDAVSRAATLLKKSGWEKDAGGSLVKKIKKAGKTETTGFTLELATSDSPELIKTAEFIKKSWEKLGIKTELKVMNVIELESGVLRPRAFETLLFGEVFGHDPDPFAFWHSSQIKDPGLNIALFANTKSDKLLEEARRETDDKARKKQYEEFQNIVRKNQGAIFLYSPNYFYGMRNFIKGMDTQKIVLSSDRFNEIENWYIKTKRVWKK